MRFPLYAMDTFFYHALGAYEFDARCEMLAELGYDATYLTLWSEPAWLDVPRLRDVKARFGLDVAAVYAQLDIADPNAESIRRVGDLLETIEGCKTVELAVNCSDKDSKRSDSDAAAVLAQLLPMAKQRGIQLLLYPHINHWLEKLSDAVRICKLIQHDHLGVIFPSFHWYAVDRSNLFENLATAKPYLKQVNICGSRLDPDGLAGKATIELIDEGELDNFAILGALQRQGYSGPLGIQGYSVGGDVYTNLKRSITAFRDIERRIAEHPNWAKLRPA